MRPGEASELVFGGESGRAAQHGWISDAEHWALIQRRLGLDDATLAQFRRDFFAEDGIDTNLLAYIDRLRAGYRVGLLSNATGDARQFFTASGIAGHFDAITISGEQGMMKPDERIYRVALGRLNVKPNEAIFVDDFSENVVAARMLGMTGVHFADPQLALAVATVDGRRIRSRRAVGPDHSLAEDIHVPDDLGSRREVVGALGRHGRLGGGPVVVLAADLDGEDRSALQELRTRRGADVAFPNGVAPGSACASRRTGADSQCGAETARSSSTSSAAAF